MTQKKIEEFIKAGKILLKSQIGFELRQLLLSKKNLLRFFVGGKITKAGEKNYNSLVKNSSASIIPNFEILDRIKVIGVGFETFTKLVSKGVFPGYGGYEVVDSNKTKNVDNTINATNSNFFLPAHEKVKTVDNEIEKNNFGSKNLTLSEEKFLINAAKEIGVVVPETNKLEATMAENKNQLNEKHLLKTSMPTVSKNLDLKFETYESSDLMKYSKESRVPSSRLARLANFGALTIGLSTGAVAELTRRTFNWNKSTINSSLFLTEANVERIVQTLCKVRGAALKLGQMLSIQNDETVPSFLLEIFERVRQNADFMPTYQVHSQMEKELGLNWKSKFKEFNDKPFAAASIGQVHKAIGLDGKLLAVKIQYPGIAESIDSDINNLISVLKFGNFFPKGFFLDSFLVVAQRELKDECDYIREAQALKLFATLTKDLNDYYVPKIYINLSTKHILTTEFIEGKSLDRCINEPQDVRNYISAKFIELCLREIFLWKFMQTDPNWSNFFFGKHPETKQPCLVLLDFGASRSYSNDFVDKYMRVISSAYDGNIDNVLKFSKEIGFLTGFESKLMEKAHCESIMILAELLTTSKPYDFSNKNVAKRIQKLIPVMLEHRLTAPPEEIYSLHRKLSGCYLIATKLKAAVLCGSLFEDIRNKYQFGNTEKSKIMTNFDKLQLN